MADSQVVRKMCVVVSALRRSVSFYSSLTNLEFVGRTDSQAVRKICVVVFALRRSVSLRGSINWNLAASPN